MKAQEDDEVTPRKKQGPATPTGDAKKAPSDGREASPPSAPSSELQSAFEDMGTAPVPNPPTGERTAGRRESATGTPQDRTHEVTDDQRRVGRSAAKSEAVGPTDEDEDTEGKDSRPTTRSESTPRTERESRRGRNGPDAV